MDCGGVPKSLLSLLGAIDKKSVNITLLFDKNEGAFSKFIPQWAETKELQYNRDITEERRIGRRAQIRNSAYKLKPITSIKKFLAFRKESKMPYYEELIHRSRRFHDAL